MNRIFERKNIIISVFVLANALSLVFIFFLYEDKGTISSETGVKKITLATQQRRVQELDSIKKEFEALGSEKSKYPEILGRNKQENYIFEKLQKTAGDSGLILKTINTSGGKTTRGFQEPMASGKQDTSLKEFQVDVAAVGTLTSLRSFLKTVEEQYPFISFNKLNFSRAGNSSETILFQITFSTYYR